jgi:hypothetical protein
MAVNRGGGGPRRGKASIAGNVPTGDPHDWRDDLPWGYGRRVREIEGRWQYAKSYSDAEAAQDVAELVAILGVVQRELDEAKASWAFLADTP